MRNINKTKMLVAILSLCTSLVFADKVDGKDSNNPTEKKTQLDIAREEVEPGARGYGNTRRRVSAEGTQGKQLKIKDAAEPYERAGKVFTSAQMKAWLDACNNSTGSKKREWKTRADTLKDPTYECNNLRKNCPDQNNIHLNGAPCADEIAEIMLFFGDTPPEVAPVRKRGFLGLFKRQK